MPLNLDLIYTVHKYANWILFFNLELKTKYTNTTINESRLPAFNEKRVTPYFRLHQHTVYTIQLFQCIQIISDRLRF